MNANVRSIEVLESRIAPAFTGNINLFLLAGSSGNGALGVRIQGDLPGDNSGYSVADAGDVNGDGLSDLIIGAPNVDVGNNNLNGAAYVIFGTASSSGFSPTLDLGNLGTKGFRIDADNLANAGFGQAVAGGDVNGDGYSDLIIGAPDYSGGAGAVAVVFGKSGGFASPVKTSTLTGANGGILVGTSLGDFTGSSVAAADVNGDGYADVVIGAPGYDLKDANNQVTDSNVGAVHVVYGHNGNSFSIASLSSIGVSGAINGFTLQGVTANDGAGGHVANAGDFNGDGRDDLLIGASGGDAVNLTDAGRVYLMYGKSGVLPAKVSLSNITGNDGAQFIGSGASDLLSSVGSAGDVNGDGLADIVLGAAFHNGAGVDSGEAYVVFGRTQNISGTFSVANANLTIHGPATNSLTGLSVSNAGDFNGDGYSDVLIGSPGGGALAGASYVVFGRPDGYSGPIDLPTLDGTAGFKLTRSNVGDSSGFSVHSAGDVNGDGYGDLIIGAKNSGSDAGESYVVFGSNGGNAVNVAADGKTATYTDADGDLVTIKTTKGMLDPTEFQLSGANALGGATLQKIDFSGHTELNASDLTILAKPQVVNGTLHGDGLVNVGFLNADSVNFGKVKVGGDLGHIIASSVKSLTVGSIGSEGLSTQAGSGANLISALGSARQINVKTNIEDASFVAAKIGAIKAGGDIENSSFFLSGGALPAKGPAVALKSLTVGGDFDHSRILGGSSLFGGNADVAIGKVVVKGDWLASSLTAGVVAGNDGQLGTADDQLYNGGNAAILSRIASVVIKGQAVGTVDPGGHFAITAEAIGSVTLGKTKLPLDPLAKDKYVAIGSTGDFVVNEV